VETGIRGYRVDDANHVVAFLLTAARRDPTLEPVSANAWKRFVSMSFNAGGRDFAIGEQGARVVALLMSAQCEESGRPQRNFRIIVDPEFRRRGIGTRLLRRVEESENGHDTTLQASTMGTWEAGAAFLVHHGFAVVRRELWMSAEEPVPARPPPPGIRLRAYRGAAGDDAAWRRLNEEAYADAPDYAPLTDEDLAVMRAEDRFHLWLAERKNGTIVGLCHTKDFGGVGCVNSVVVTAAARGKGIGRALLDAGLATLRANGPQRVRLSVRSDNETAIAIYAAAGFAKDDEILAWHR